MQCDGGEVGNEVKLPTKLQEYVVKNLVGYSIVLTGSGCMFCLAVLCTLMCKCCAFVC